MEMVRFAITGTAPSSGYRWHRTPPSIDLCLAAFFFAETTGLSVELGPPRVSVAVGLDRPIRAGQMDSFSNFTRRA
jgi:hypothetical protein